jgi:TRAP-type uncharacterized transport system fused permease subunit
VLVAVLGILPLAGAIAGFLNRRLRAVERVLLFAAAALLLFPVGPALAGMRNFTWVDLAGAVLLFVMLGWTWRTRRAPSDVLEPSQELTRGSGTGAT